MEQITTKSEYYTPAPGDIRIGYECECLWCCKEPRPWLLITVVENDNLGTKSLPIEQIYSRLKSKEIRTPYLTKEQIEAEGWREIHHREYLSKDNRIHFFNGIKEWGDDDNEYLSSFKIHNKNKVLFEGNCPSISEFKYICKLLGI